MTPPSLERRPVLGVAALVVTVCLWGLSGVAIKAVSTSGVVTALYRLWFAIPLLWSTMLSRRLRARLDRRWLRASIIGGTMFGVHQVFFFTSLKMTSVANVTIIGALQPVLVLLVAGRMFSEPMGRGAAAWTAVAFAGVAMVVLGSAGSPTWSPAGDALAALNVVAFTVYCLASKSFRRDTGAWEYVVGMTTMAGVVMTAVVFSTGQDLGRPAPWEWAVLVAIAVFPGSLGHALSNWAHAHVSAFVASIILLAVPVVAAAGAWVLLDEPLGTMQVAGGAIVLAAIATIVLSTPPREAEELAEGAAATDAP